MDHHQHRGDRVTATFRIGQTVRWSPELTEWYDDTSDTSAAQVGRIVTVVFLQGGRPTFGPKAAEIAGRMYRNLYDHSFFGNHATLQPASLAASH